MRTRTVLAAASLFALALVAQPAAAQQSKTICNDGTTSEAVGRGACSNHGGVKTMGTAASTKTAKSAAKAAEKSAKTETKAAEKVAKTETKAAEKVAKTETKAATKTARAEPKEVTCTDGTASKPGRGACSGHGGVKKAGSKAKKG